MSERPEGKWERRASSLADLRLSEQTADSVVGQIGQLAVQALEGWDAAATSLVDGNRVATFGTTDPVVNELDQAQYDAHGGPCVDALGGEIQYFTPKKAKPSWGEFARAAADAGIRSVVSFPLKVDDEVMGALNFYSREQDALRSGQREEGLLFASQAAVTLSNAADYVEQGTKIGQLEEGLESRTMIGQATGLLMAQEGLTSEEAFQRLVTISQAANVKLREIAQRYVATWEDTVAGKKEENTP